MYNERETLMGSCVSQNIPISPKNEIKSAAALIRCLATNEEVLYSENIELRIIKALKKINECAYQTTYDLSLYKDVKDAIDTLNARHPSKYVIFNSYAETALNLLKPLESSIAFETAKNCVAHEVSSSSHISPPITRQVQPIIGPTLNAESRQMKPLSISLNDASKHDCEYGFYDMSTEHG